MKPQTEQQTQTLHAKGTRLSIKPNREAVVLENKIKDAAYLVAYKKSDGSWSTMNISNDMIEKIWVDPIEVEFLSSIIEANRDSVKLSIDNRITADAITNLKDKRINVTLTERK